MKRIIATLEIFPLVAFMLWLGGYDFDQRNPFARAAIAKVRKP